MASPTVLEIQVNLVQLEVLHVEDTKHRLKHNSKTTKLQHSGRVALGSFGRKAVTRSDVSTWVALTSIHRNSSQDRVLKIGPGPQKHLITNN